MKKSPAPRALGPKASKVWSETTDAYELEAHELRVLEDACREIDLVERMERQLKSETLVVSGSMGQPVTNPLVGEIRQHRAMVQKLLSGLKLPAEEAAAKAARSTSARAAANARWGNVGA